MKPLSIIAAILRFPLFLLVLLGSPIIWLLFFAVEESPREASKMVKEFLRFYVFGAKRWSERRTNDE